MKLALMLAFVTFLINSCSPDDEVLSNSSLFGVKLENYPVDGASLNNTNCFIECIENYYITIPQFQVKSSALEISDKLEIFNHGHIINCYTGEPDKEFSYKTELGSLKSDGLFTSNIDVYSTVDFSSRFSISPYVETNRGVIVGKEFEVTFNSELKWDLSFSTAGSQFNYNANLNWYGRDNSIKSQIEISELGFVFNEYAANKMPNISDYKFPIGTAHLTKENFNWTASFVESLDTGLELGKTYNLRIYVMMDGYVYYFNSSTVKF